MQPSMRSLRHPMRRPLVMCGMPWGWAAGSPRQHVRRHCRMSMAPSHEYRSSTRHTSTSHSQGKANTNTSTAPGFLKSGRDVLRYCSRLNLFELRVGSSTWANFQCLNGLGVNEHRLQHLDPSGLWHAFQCLVRNTSRDTSRDHLVAT